MRTRKYLTILAIIHTAQLAAEIVITHQRDGDLGDKIATFCNAWILAKKYQLPFYYQPFRDSHLFQFDQLQETKRSTKRKMGAQLNNYRTIKITSEAELSAHINQPAAPNLVLAVAINTQIADIAPDLYQQLKKLVQLQQNYPMSHIPKDHRAVAIHIRKGNGGGQFYDGQLASEQLFEFDRTQVKYETSYDRYPFQWELDLTYPEVTNPIIAYGDASGPLLLDKVAYTFDLKFPPEQYYLDQLDKLSQQLNHPLILAQIFTDDKDPHSLVQRLQQQLKLPNIKLYYLDNRAKDYSTRIAEDLSMMSQCSGLIRSQSYFARAAEVIGHHKYVIFPMGSVWQNNRRIINRIVIKS